MKIGLIVAVEINAVKEIMGQCKEEIWCNGQLIRLYESGEHKVFVFHTGAGEIAAAAGTQLLISQFDVDVIMNFGVVGALTEEMTKHRLCIVEKVVHYDLDTTYYDGCEPGRYYFLPDRYIPTDEKLMKLAIDVRPDLKPVVCASGDKFMEGREKKSRLAKEFGADICDMEAAGIALTCYKNKKPCMMIKMVSDGIEGGIEEFRQTLEEASRFCLITMHEVLGETLKNL